MSEQEALLRLTSLCSTAEHCSHEMLEKMRRWEIDEDAQTRIMEYLVKEKYIDDERYVKKYMQQPSNKSQRQKEFELEKKGIPRDLIRQCKEALEEELLSELQSELQSEDNERATGKKQGETDLIQNLLEKRCKNPETADQKEKMKHYAYLARKGFRTEDILNVFDTFFVQN